MISEHSLEVVVGHRDGDTISIQVLGRAHPGSTGYWDSNWLTIRLRLSVGSFQAAIQASLRAEELHRFEEGLRRLRASAQQEVLFEPMEEWVTLNFKNDAPDRIILSGRVTDRPGSPNELTFRIDEVNQSDLIATIAALREVNATFPILGTS